MCLRYLVMKIVGKTWRRRKRPYSDVRLALQISEYFTDHEPVLLIRSSTPKDVESVETARPQAKLF